MDCRDAQDKISECIDRPLSPDERRQLDIHLASCAQCTEFSQLQTTLDLQLRQAVTAPQLGVDFRARLYARIDPKPRGMWPHWLPDVGYLAGCGVAVLCCVLLLPFPVSRMLWIGGLATAIGYSLQTLLFTSLEEL
jgi:hypothetical protein